MSARISSYGAQGAQGALQKQRPNTSMGSASYQTAKVNSHANIGLVAGSSRRDFSPANQLSYEQAMKDRARLQDQLEGAQRDFRRKEANFAK